MESKVKTTLEDLEVETTLSRCRNYPLPKGMEMTPRGQNYSFEFTVYFMCVGTYCYVLVFYFFVGTYCYVIGELIEGLLFSKI